MGAGGSPDNETKASTGKLLKEAERQLIAVLKVHDRFAFGHFLLGEVFEEVGNGIAVEEYQRAIQ